MKITFITHSTCLLEINKKKILLDPFISENPKCDNFLLKKYLSQKIDYILLTHAHYDHFCDVELFYKENSSILIISNYEISVYLKNRGIKKTYGINYGSFINFPFGKLRYTWAAHSSSFPDGSYGGNPGGFLIHTKEGNIYISGDTSVTNEMRIIPYFGKIKLSILPIGGKFTMDVNDALIASDFLKSNVVLGVHYNTFDEICIDKEESKKIFSQKGKKLILLRKDNFIEI